MVFFGAPSVAATAVAFNPLSPCFTRRRNVSRRLSWASADRMRRHFDLVILPLPTIRPVLIRSASPIGFAASASIDAAASGKADPHADRPLGRPAEATKGSDLFAKTGTQLLI